MDKNSSYQSNHATTPSTNDTRHSDQGNYASESFGNSSERKPIVSESGFKLSENNSEPFRKLTKSSEKTLGHTLTVRETAKIFEDAGVPRTERSIINWCNQNSQGQCRLDCFYNESEHKYYITPDSIQEIIREEKSKMRNDSEYLNNLSESRQEFSESFGNNINNFPKASETNGRISEKITNDVASPITESLKTYDEVEEKNRRIAKLESELEEIKEDKIRAETSTVYKDELLTFFKSQIANDREDYNNRMKFMQDQIIQLQEQGNKYVEQTIDSHRRIGSLESQLRQLEAPRHERKHDDREMNQIKYREADRDITPEQTRDFEMRESEPESDTVDAVTEDANRTQNVDDETEWQRDTQENDIPRRVFVTPPPFPAESHPSEER